MARPARTQVVAGDASFPLKLLLDHGLRGNACVVCTGNPQSVAPAHAVPPHQCVLHTPALQAYHLLAYPIAKEHRSVQLSPNTWQS